MIRFCLNGTWVSEDQVDPSTTILRYLRTSLGQTGTKEGCGSGDCGACTVMIGDYVDGGWQYKAVNSCITLLASVHGRHLVTVEGLANATAGPQLHPVQQALVDNHGSQCGFCTPGFVMSLAALNEQSAAASEPQVVDAISGNLCRCTGYRPILDAALNTNPQENYRPRYHSASAPEPSLDYAQLIRDQKHCIYPQTETQLRQLLQQHPSAHIVAGGTDLLLQQTQNFQPLTQIIGVGQVAELQMLAIENQRVSVGAAVTYTQIEQTLAQKFPAFIDLLHRLGSRQIRNQATLVGNIANASPIGDTPPFLLTLNATLTLASHQGERCLPLVDFFLDYKKTQLQQGEYIRQAEFDIPGSHDFMRAYKISKRYEDDISAVLMALRWQVVNGVFQEVKVAFGGMAAIPKRATALEQFLQGKTAGEQTLLDAASAIDTDFAPISDVRASANYRQQVAKNLLLKAWLESQAQSVSVWQPGPTRRSQQIFRGQDA